MSEPLLNKDMYEIYKDNLFVVGRNDPNEFLKYILFCSVSGQGYNFNDMVDDMFNTELELNEIIIQYNKQRGNMIVFDFVRRTFPLNLDNLMSALVTMNNLGITLNDIRSNIHRYKAEEYDTSKLGNLVQQLVSYPSALYL